ncbi:MAG: glycosyltransferase family protein [Microbacteriaceae bacterium]|nr:glycosyltransferase family protein [Microbacteriaceae bacterium]
MIVGVLQARMSSSRLPGKVLAPLAGQPMILRIVERIRRSRELDDLVVVTSTDPSDDPLVHVLEGAGVTVRRGSLTDVLSRFVAVAEEFEPEAIVRLTGDNPLVDPDVIDLVVRAHRDGGADYTSNSLTRTFPDGLNAEAVDPAALLSLAARPLQPDEHEHVTIGVYRRPEEFRIAQVTQAEDHSELRWTVDYPEDFAFAEAVYDRLHSQNPGFGQADVLALLEREPELRRTVADAT